MHLTFKKCGIVAFLMLLVFLFACNKRITDAVETAPTVVLPGFGQENTLEIASWNIERFPLQGDVTVDKVAEIILDLDIDIYAVEEIVSESEMAVLIDSLNSADSLAGYDFRLNQFANDIKTGIIFKSSIVTLESETVLFNGDSDFAGRPPYVLKLRATKNSKSFDFTLIVLHLKAFGDQQSEDRRRRSIQKLEDYVTAQIENPANDPDYIIAGDWNDELDDPTNDNVFLPFLQDSLHYRFLTESFLGDPDEFSFIDGFESLIDHILITTSVDSAYPGHTTEILKIDQDVNQYIPQVSDHRPVAAKFPVF